MHRLADDDSTSLDNAGSLADAIFRLTPQCQPCMLATIGAVCGPDCIGERLHLQLLEKHMPQACFPDLARRLSQEQGRQLHQRLRLLEPLGIVGQTVAHDVSDLYLPSEESILGGRVFRGLDTGYHLVSCGLESYPGLVAFTASADRSEWLRCEGMLWVNITSGEGRSARDPTDATALVVNIHAALSGCYAAFKVEPPLFTEDLLLCPETMPPEHVACWLARFFGVQAAAPNGAEPRPGLRLKVVEIAAGLAPIRLIGDVIVRDGARLLIKGNGNTLLVGNHQVRVRVGGELRLDNLTIAESQLSPALVVEGHVVAVHTTFRDCSSRVNGVTAYGTGAAGGAIRVAGGRLELKSSELMRNSADASAPESGTGTVAMGGAIFASMASVVTIVDSRLYLNKAVNTEDDKMRAFGGCIFASSSSLVVLGSSIHRNSAEAGDGKGGGWFIDRGSVEIDRSEIVANTATTSGGGMMMRDEAYLQVSSSQFLDNAAGVEGGALSIQLKSTANITHSQVVNNSASQRNCSRPDVVSLGGGIFVSDRSTLRLSSSILLRNIAKGCSGAPGGGAIYVIQSRLTVRSCDAGDNAAQGLRAAVSAGGFIHVGAPSYLDITDSRIYKNQASLGGAIYAEYGRSNVTIAACDLRSNRAAAAATLSDGDSSEAMCAGGAIYVDAQVRVELMDSNLTFNQVVGSSAEGGAIWSCGESLTLWRCVIRGNEVTAGGYKGKAIGAGIHIGDGEASLSGCLLAENVAKMNASSAIQATAGAIFVSGTARAILHRCELYANAAGGRGKYEFVEKNQLPQFVTSAVEAKATAAAHIYVQGSIVLEESTITDEAGPPSIDSPAWWWIVVVQNGALVLRKSSFKAGAEYVFDPCPYTGDRVCQVASKICSEGDYDDCETPRPIAGPGKLLHVPSQGAEVLIDGCSVTNLTMQSEFNRIAVVNSTLVPALNRSLNKLKPPNCGQKVANEAVCDPRAECFEGDSGGVECSCTLIGLRDKPGAQRNGRHCEQATLVRLSLKSEHIEIALEKPGTSAALGVEVYATGEDAFDARFTLSMERTSGNGTSISMREWTSADAQQASLDGHHVTWATPPSNGSRVDLDASTSKFSFARTFDLVIHLNCSGAVEDDRCVKDGETVVTVLNASSYSSADAELRSSIRITSRVQSLISCRSKGWIEELRPAAETTVLRTFPVVLRATAQDVNGFAMRYTRAQLEFWWDDRPVYDSWFEGEHSATVDPDWYADVGTYEASIIAVNGWNHPSSRTEPCVLFETTIHVQSDNIQLIVAGALSSLLILTIGLLTYLLARNRAKAKELLMSFLEFEGSLVLEIVLELWVRPRSPIAHCSPSGCRVVCVTMSSVGRT